MKLVIKNQTNYSIIPQYLPKTILSKQPTHASLAFNYKDNIEEPLDTTILLRVIQGVGENSFAEVRYTKLTRVAPRFLGVLIIC